MKNLLHEPFPYKYSHATAKLILVNFAVFGLSYFFADAGALVYYFGAMNVRLVETYHMFWQFLTYMFVHQNFSHVLFNMLGLLFFGLPVEKKIGSREFTLFYFVCGVLGGFFSYLVYKFTAQQNVSLLGASGAVYAVLFAYAVIFPQSVIFIWGIIPVPAPVLVLLYTVIEIGSQFLGTSSNVAHMTHLFGFFAAWLYFVLRMGVHPIKVWKNRFR